MEIELRVLNNHGPSWEGLLLHKHLKVCSCVAFKRPKDVLKPQSKGLLAYIPFTLSFPGREMARCASGSKSYWSLHSVSLPPTHFSSCLFCFIFERGINQVQTKLITDPVRTDLLKAHPVEELQGMSSGGAGEGEKGMGIPTPLRDI